MNKLKVELSILDLAKYSQGQSLTEAFAHSKDLAQHADDWGFKRFWMAEHHNIEGVASSATPVLLGYIAENTKSIRVGAGGIMLPNHSPLVVAETFGTLEALYPGRIDLGLGRAPGSDQTTMRAVRRDTRVGGDDFASLIEELESYLAPAVPGQKVRAIPGAGLDIPLWILGSSLYSAHLAAKLGRPYSFAAHFAPGLLFEAIDVYRSEFQPSRHLEKPHLMVGVPVMAADSDERAEYLATSIYQTFLNLIRGDRKPIAPPVKSMKDLWSYGEKEAVASMIGMIIVGDREKVRLGLETLIDRTGADEIIITSDPYDFKDRLKSFEIIASLR